MKKIISTDKAPEAIGPYSQAVETGNTIYISGQIPLDRKTGRIVEGGIEEQTEQVMKNIGAILKAAGLDYSHVVKSTVLLKDIKDFKAVNEIYGKYYRETPPARAAFQAGALPLDVMVEIETIAVR